MNNFVAKQADAAGPASDSNRLAVSVEAIRALPASFAKEHRVLPLKIDNGVIHIATSAPGNARVIDDIRLLTGLEVEESEAAESHISEKSPRVTRSRWRR